MVYPAQDLHLHALLALGLAWQLAHFTSLSLNGRQRRLILTAASSSIHPMGIAPVVWRQLHLYPAYRLALAPRADT